MSGAVVASTISGSVAPLMIPLFEWAFDLAEGRKVKDKVEREFRKRSGNLPVSAVGVALTQAYAAIELSRFSLGDAVRLNFDSTSSTNLIASHLDRSLSNPEEKHARLAIHVWCDEFFRTARQGNSAIFEMIADCLRRLVEIERAASLGEEKIEYKLLRNAVTRKSAARLLADSTRSDTFHGDAARRCLQSMRWDWNVEASAHLRAIGHLRNLDGFDLGRSLDVLMAVDSSSDSLCTWWCLRSEEVSEALRALGGWARDARHQVPDDVTVGLKWLSEETKSPRFGFVVPIFGTWGSGKSRLLDELVQRGLDQRAISLQLEVRGSLSEAIDRAAQAILGDSIGGGASLHTICNNSERVIIVIDDFDAIIARTPEVFDEFWQLVWAWNGRSIRWVVACDEASLPQMMKRGGNRFWPQYGARPAASLGTDATGWLALDDHNDRTNIGLSILVQSGEGDAIELKELISGDPAGYPLRRELNRPMTALLRLRDNMKEPLDQIHLMSLMSAYWRLLLKNLEQTDSTDPEMLDRLMRSMARESLGIASPVEPTGVTDKPFRISRATSDTEWSLSALARRNVVDAIESAYVPGAEMNSLWGYLFCSELGLSDPLGSNVTSWKDAAETLRLLHLDGRGEAERALRFLFVWAAQRSYAAHANNDFTPWWDAVDDPDFPREVLWEAAVCLPESLVVPVVARTRQSLVTSDEVFWILRLVRLTTWSATTAAVGIEFITRTFERIDALGLSTYAELALVKVIDAFPWTSASDAQKAITRLGALTSVPLGWVAAERIVGLVEFQKSDTRVVWLTLLDEVIKATPEPDDIASIEVTVADEALPFWLAIVRCSLREIAASAGPAMIDDLIQVGWFSNCFLHSTGSRRVAQLAQREAHNAFARTFEDSYDEFIERALRLARGDVRGVTQETQALIALYAVRHTKSTKGNLVVSVDRRLRVVTEALTQSDHLPNRHQYRLDSIKFDADYPAGT